jgi:hypothetical protein
MLLANQHIVDFLYTGELLVDQVISCETCIARTNTQPYFNTQERS